MIYSTKPAFLFIHIPKTAGTSIRAQLSGFGGSPGLANYLARRTSPTSPVARIMRLHRRRTFDSHTPFHLASEIIPSGEVDQAFKFCFVRNPYDRIVSFYHHVLAHPEHPWHRKISDYGSFDNMVLNLDEVGEPTQVSYMVTPSGRIAMDFIGRFESIDEDFKVVCDSLGIAGHLERKNSNPHGHWLDYYSDDSLELVFRYYREDFERLGYQAGLQ